MVGTKLKSIFKKLLSINSERWSKSKSIAVLLSTAICIPIIFIISYLFIPGGETWNFILENLFWHYVTETFILMIFTAVFVTIIGVSTAWLVSTYNFPFVKHFEWLLILPLAIPGYIAAYTYSGMFDITGPVYFFLNNYLGHQNTISLLPEVKSMSGGIFILSIVLYPYVYVVTRAYFSVQYTSYTEVASSLGLSNFQSFFRLAVPMARPAIVAGVSLVLMELLNDYGTVKYLGINTFTIGIFTSWSSFGDTRAALKIAAWLLFIVVAILYLERRQRGSARFETQDNTSTIATKQHLKGFSAFIAVLVCGLPFLLGFLLPVVQLLYWASLTYADVLNMNFLILIQNSFVLAFTAAGICILIGIALAYLQRIENSFIQKIIIRLATVGYAIPGAVIAMGILVPAVAIDRQLIGFVQFFNSDFNQLILTGSIGILVYGYVVRFLAVSFNSLDSGFEKIPRVLDETSRSLGYSPFQTLYKVNLPLLKKSIIAAGILAFVDIIKELPLTLILRPFNFDTLAIKAFELASDEQIAQSAPAALVIIITGIVPILILNRIFAKLK